MEMNLKQAATIITTGGALAAWLVGGVTTPPHVAPTPAAQASPVDTKSAELQMELGRLHDRLRPTAAPRQPGRNLFRFHAAPAPIAPAAPPPADPVEAPPPAPIVTPMRLVGLAEDPGPD